MAANGQQIYFNGPRGTSQVSVTGKNQDNIRATWNGQADSDGNAFTKDWWFKEDVEIEYVLNGAKHTKTISVPASGDGTFEVDA